MTFDRMKLLRLRNSHLVISVIDTGLVFFVTHRMFVAIFARYSTEDFEVFGVNRILLCV